MEFMKSSGKSVFLKSGNYLLADIFNNRSFESDKRNKTQKNFNRILDNKHKLLKAQILRVKNANINLESYQRLKKLSLFRISLKKRQDFLLINSATKIQKIFRGYITRKKTLPTSLKLQKTLALSKIEELRHSVNNYFFNRKYTEDAVIKIQRSYRSYRKRMILEAYISLWQRLKTIYECKKLLKLSFKLFGSKIKVIRLKENLEFERLLRKFRENHAIKVISRFWKQQRMSKKKFIKRTRRYKKANRKYSDDKTRGSIQKDGGYSRKNSENAYNSSEKVISKKNSIRKTTKMLPYLPISPKKIQTKAMMFLIKPKRVATLNNLISKSVAGRSPDQSKDFSIIFPKLFN